MRIQRLSIDDMIGIQIDPITNDLALPEGRMALGEVREQTAQFLLEGVPATPGGAPPSFGEYPTLGLAIRRHLGGPFDPMFSTKAVKMMRHCLIPVDHITPSSEGYNIIFKD